MKTVLTCCFALGVLLAFSASKESHIGPLGAIYPKDSLGIATEVLKVKSYPNPFTDQVTFVLLKSLPADAEMAIYDISGRKVASLDVSGNGTRILWGGTNSSGARVHPGTYIYVLPGMDQYGRGKIVFSP